MQLEVSIKFSKYLFKITILLACFKRQFAEIEATIALFSPLFKEKKQVIRFLI